MSSSATHPIFPKYRKKTKPFSVNKTFHASIQNIFIIWLSYTSELYWEHLQICKDSSEPPLFTYTLTHTLILHV